MSRESFEQAYWNTGIPIKVIGTEEIIFAKDEFGEYKIPHVAGAWWGWCNGKKAEKEKGTTST